MQHGIDKGRAQEHRQREAAHGHRALRPEEAAGSARKWFQQARDYPEQRKQADGWVQHINAELAA